MQEGSDPRLERAARWLNATDWTLAKDRELETMLWLLLPETAQIDDAHHAQIQGMLAAIEPVAGQLPPHRPVMAVAESNQQHHLLGEALMVERMAQAGALFVLHHAARGGTMAAYVIDVLTGTASSSSARDRSRRLRLLAEMQPRALIKLARATAGMGEWPPGTSHPI